MSIPCKMRPVGLESLPIGYTRLEFLESTGTQYIKMENVYYADVLELDFETVRSNSNDVYVFGALAGKPRQTIENQEQSITFCFGNENKSEYSLNLSNAANKRYKIKIIRPGYKVYVNGVNRSYTRLFDVGLASKAIPLQAPYLYNGTTGTPAKIFSLKLESEGDMYSLVPALTADGKPCMFDTVHKKDYTNSGTGSFVVGMTAKQALNLANLPETDGGGFTISLPLEAAFDAKVKSALEAAADKGWNIPVQYRASELSAKYIEADFLESDGNQYLRLPELTVTNDDSIKVRWSLESFSGTSADGVFAIYNYDSGQRLRTYVTIGRSASERGYGYAWGSQKGSLQRISQKEIIDLEMSNTGVTVNDVLTSYENTTPFSYSDMLIFNQYVQGRFWPARMKLYNFEVPSKCYLLPALDLAGAPCMYDTVSGQYFRDEDKTITDEGEEIPFIVGFNTTEKAAVSLSKLPVTSGGTLTVSLPAAADGDELFGIATDIATSRGWRIDTRFRTN